MRKTRYLEIDHLIHHTNKKKLICDLYQEILFREAIVHFFDPIPADSHCRMLT
jgi:hypothetical protein